MGVSPSGSAAPAVPLRRNGNFQRLWFGSAVGFLGMEAADIGYPLVILALTGSPAQAALFGVVQTAAMLLCGLPAGDVVDRRDHRRVLLAADGGRGIAVASVALAAALDRLTLVHLLAVACVLGAGSAFGAPARMLVLRAIVAPQQLTAALTQEEVRDGAARLAGPALGGVLFGLRQTAPFVFSAAGFAVSWMCALAIRIPRQASPPASGPAPGDAPTGTGGQRSQMLLGMRTLWADPTIRAATLVITALNTAAAPLALITIVILTEQGTPPWLIGVAMSGMAIGSLAGTPLIKPLHRLRPGVLLIMVVLTEAPLFAALAVPLGPWWVMAVLCCAMVGVPALRVLVDILIFRQVPDEQRGRVISAVILLFGLGAPLGTAAAGLLLEFLSPSAAVLVVAGALALAGWRATNQRALRDASWPA